LLPDTTLAKTTPVAPVEIWIPVLGDMGGGTGTSHRGVDDEACRTAAVGDDAALAAAGLGERIGTDVLHRGLGQCQCRAALDQDPVQVVVADIGGQSPWTAIPLIDTETPFVFAPPAAAAQTSTTDWGTCAEVAFAWQFVVDSAGVAGSSIRTRPLRGHG
jgi:hypothetical protein